MHIKETYRSGCSAAALLVAVGGAVLLSSPVLAQAANVPPAAAANQPSPTNPEAIVPEIIVTGSSEHRGWAGGLMKVQTAAEAMSSITPAAIQEKISFASPLQIIQTIPGVNFGSSNAYGLAGRNFLSIRGLDETEIGFMFEGIPGTDVEAYFPFAESWADPENISDITVTPGNSRLQDPIINASGGEVIESVRDPQDKLGGMIDAAAGSFRGLRAFARFDTGYIGDSGIKAFASYSQTSAGNYVGPGTGSREHADFKVLKDWSAGSQSSLFFSFNSLTDARIPPLTLAQFNNAKATNNFDQYQYASSFTPGVTANYYRLYIDHKNNYLLANKNKFELGTNVTLNITPYYKYTFLQAPGEAVLNPASLYSGNQLVTAAYDPADLQNGKLYTQNNITFIQHQYGVTSAVEAALSPSNHLIFGYWFDHWRLTYSSGYNIVDQSGASDGTTDANQLTTTQGAMITGSNFAAHTITNQLFIGDTQSLLNDKLSISVGFKELFYKAAVDNYVIGSVGPTSLSLNRALPRVLASYDVNSQIQIYGNVTTSARMPNVAGTYVTEYSATTGGFATVADLSARPEYTVSGQAGLRYHGALNIDVNAFRMHLANHQVSSLQTINGSLVPIAISAGGETIRGASIEVATHKYAGFSFYGNTQYLKGTFDDNIAVGADFLPTKGKDMVLSPSWIGNLGGRFETGGFFAQASVKYVGPQYSTFMNDQEMQSFTLVDAAAGYRFSNIPGLTEPTIRLNLTNIGNKIYAASIASITTNALPTLGMKGTVIKGATPSYYIGAPLTAVVTLSTKF